MKEDHSGDVPEKGTRRELTKTKQIHLAVALLAEMTAGHVTVITLSKLAEFYDVTPKQMRNFLKKLQPYISLQSDLDDSPVNFQGQSRASWFRIKLQNLKLLPSVENSLPISEVLRRLKDRRK